MTYLKVLSLARYLVPIVCCVYLCRFSSFKMRPSVVALGKHFGNLGKVCGRS